MAETVTVTLDEASDLCLRVLTGAGLGRRHAEAVAAVIVAGQRDECHSHGLYRLIGCARALATGRVNKAAMPKVIDSAPSILKVDADFGFSSYAYNEGIELAVEKARSQGLAAFVINNCYHFSALWPEVEPLAERGFAALALTPSHSWVAPAGGTKPVFGTNPIAFAWPRVDNHPFVFDFATSATARGEIELHRRAGKSLVPGLALDRNGQPTVDPAEALRGAMLTFGGHKGSALSTMVELLAGPLINDLISLESKALDDGLDATPCHGELILIFDPRVFLGEALGKNLARAELLFDAIIGQDARLPSQRRYQARLNSLHAGMSVQRSVYEELIALVKTLGASRNVCACERPA
ncbi:Ldh family oxidoreductase [Methylovirgula sp. 4M-Z18]|uniref:Ldh family oxidoreductase n=1 Tax=Methylovirgula sp. 4M-Z18 TaxID=2293567 RepID=UPI000E2F5EBA|nr:Ldh family oxidoreductase [Methylovirgula sp. 4M-Z18]RFB76518.1 Ldh family oxidoreductase [Methylovirgula sp. 4M-Z18]